MARKKWRQNRNYAHAHCRYSPAKELDTRANQKICGYNRVRVDGWKRFEYAACGRENFRIRKKIFAEKKISGYVWTWPKSRNRWIVIVNCSTRINTGKCSAHCTNYTVCSPELNYCRIAFDINNIAYNTFNLHKLTATLHPVVWFTIGLV